MHDNKQNNETQTYGKIEKGGFFLRQYVGEATSSDGKKFEIATTMQGEPLIVYGNKMFKLSWLRHLLDWTPRQRNGSDVRSVCERTGSSLKKGLCTRSVLQNLRKIRNSAKCSRLPAISCL